MKQSLPLPEGKKLSVTCRVESGCLGPDGANKIGAFCLFAQQKIQFLDSDYVIWYIVPRENKQLPEIQYNATGKKMNHSQAERYLALFGKNLDEFESHLSEKLAGLIEGYIG